MPYSLYTPQLQLTVQILATISLKLGAHFSAGLNKSGAVRSSSPCGLLPPSQQASSTHISAAVQTCPNSPHQIHYRFPTTQTISSNAFVRFVPRPQQANREAKLANYLDFTLSRVLELVKPSLISLSVPVKFFTSLLSSSGVGTVPGAQGTIFQDLQN